MVVPDAELRSSAHVVLHAVREAQRGRRERLEREYDPVVVHLLRATGARSRRHPRHGTDKTRKLAETSGSRNAQRKKRTASQPSLDGRSRRRSDPVDRVSSSAFAYGHCAKSCRLRSSSLRSLFAAEGACRSQLVQVQHWERLLRRTLPPPSVPENFNTFPECLKPPLNTRIIVFLRFYYKLLFCRSISSRSCRWCCLSSAATVVKILNGIWSFSKSAEIPLVANPCSVRKQSEGDQPLMFTSLRISAKIKLN